MSLDHFRKFVYKWKIVTEEANQLFQLQKHQAASDIYEKSLAFAIQLN